jgi:hypothetical protein
MSIQVEEPYKVIFARVLGPNKLFEGYANVDQRKRMSDQELAAIFDRVWESRLKEAVSRADVYESSQQAYERLPERYRQYFEFDQEHRYFRLQDLNIDFIAQLKKSDENGWKLTQLWMIPSSDINPKTLYVTFETVEERKQFKRLATKLGRNDQELGLQLVLEFMRKFPEKFYSE